MGIGNNCHIENAIIDKNARIGDRVTIIGSKKMKNERLETHCVVEGIIVIRKGAVIPNGTVIGQKKTAKAKPKTATKTKRTVKAKK